MISIVILVTDIFIHATFVNLEESTLSMVKMISNRYDTAMMNGLRIIHVAINGVHLLETISCSCYTLIKFTTLLERMTDICNINIFIYPYYQCFCRQLRRVYHFLNVIEQTSRRRSYAVGINCECPIIVHLQITIKTVVYPITLGTSSHSNVIVHRIGITQ